MDSVGGFNSAALLNNIDEGTVDKLIKTISKAIENPNDATCGTKSFACGNKPDLPAPVESSMAIMFTILAKLKEIVDETNESVKSDLEQKEHLQKALLAEKLEKSQEQFDKRCEQIKEANDQADKAKKGGVFGAVFGFITGVASVIGGICSIAAGVVSGQPSLIAGGAFMVAAGCCDIAAQICTLCGEDEAAEILGYVSIACTIIGLGCLTYGAYAAAGAAKAGAAATKEASEEVTEQIVKEAAEEVIKESIEKAIKSSADEVAQRLAQNTIQRVTDIINLASTIVIAGGNIAKGVISVEIAEHQEKINAIEEQIQELNAQTEENKALLLKVQAMIERLMEFMNQMAQGLVNATDIVSSIIDDQSSTNHHLARAAAI